MRTSKDRREFPQPDKDYLTKKPTADIMMKNWVLSQDQEKDKEQDTSSQHCTSGSSQYKWKKNK